MGAMATKGVLIVSALSLMAIIEFGGLASAQQSQAVEWCDNKNGNFSPDLMIRGCTTLIQSRKRSKQNLAAPYHNRGYAYHSKGDNDRAIADYNETIRLDPKYLFAYFGRGITNLYAGALPKSLADLNQATALNPKYAYAALWLDIVAQRSNAPSRLSEAISTTDMTAWPAPVIRMFLGQMPPAAVLAAADDPDGMKKKGQVCEAIFYTGELALRQGAKNEAARLFRLAAGDCPRTFIEWFAANAELKALGVAP
jgi:lipoprotein NlpI